MRVVSDTSPLSNLALIGRLGLLREQFAEVLMPRAVSRELSALRDATASLTLDRAMADGWLKETALPDDSPFPSELQGLDPGETEALRLALSISADRVLMDEWDGRMRATALGVRTIGVLGVLIVGKRSGSIVSMKVEIARLREEAGFFISRDLQEQVLAMAGE